MSFLYHVMRDKTHDGMDIRGSYWSLDEANAAAREDLTKEWGEDAFQEYEEEVFDDGSVSIEATFQEGETASVSVVKKKVPPQPADPIIKEALESTPVPAVAWIIHQTDWAHHRDEEGHTSVVDNLFYTSLVDANRAAEAAMRETCKNDDSDEEDEEVDTRRAESTSIPYNLTLPAQDGERSQVKIQVVKLTMSPSMFVEGSRKRARVDSS